MEETMIVSIDSDEELQEDPYLVVRFTWCTDGRSIHHVTWQVMVNDGKQIHEEIRQRVEQFLSRRREEDDQEIIDQAREVLVLNAAEQKFDCTKEGG
jgi:hypothetical protein